MNRTEYNNFSAQYINTLPSLKKSDLTIRSYKMVLSKFGEYLNGLNDGEQQITEITIVNFRSALYSAGVKTNSIANYLIILHGFFEWAIRMKLVNTNPVEIEEIPKQQEVEHDILSLDEIKKVLTDIPPYINRKTALRNRAIVVLLVQVGLRNAELRTLPLSALDFENGCIKIMHGKGDKQRIVAFPALSRQLVQEYLKSGVRPSNLSPDNYLFGTDADESGHSTDGKIWKAFSSMGLLTLVNRYTRLCCGHQVGVHALRHCAASYWDNLGVKMRDIQTALGHSSIQTTERIYTHILNKSKAANLINQAFDSALVI